MFNVLSVCVLPPRPIESGFFQPRSDISSIIMYYMYVKRIIIPWWIGSQTTDIPSNFKKFETNVVSNSFNSSCDMGIIFWRLTIDNQWRVLEQLQVYSISLLSYLWNLLNIFKKIMRVTIIFEYLLAVSPDFTRDKMTTPKMRCYVYRRISIIDKFIRTIHFN